MNFPCFHLVKLQACIRNFRTHACSGEDIAELNVPLARENPGDYSELRNTTFATSRI